MDIKGKSNKIVHFWRQIIKSKKKLSFWFVHDLSIYIQNSFESSREKNGLNGNVAIFIKASGSYL